MRIIKIFLLLTILLVSCRKESLQNFEVYNSVIKTEDIDKRMLMERLSIKKKALLTILPESKIRSVALRYKTKDQNGKDIYASGTVMYTLGQTSFQTKGTVLGTHFTIGSNEECPTARMVSYEALMVLLGYVVIAPDYIGYGESVDKIHTYHHYKTTAQASIDMLFAAREYFASLNMQLPRNVTIMGYSEGGYAAVACQKMLEQKYDNFVSIDRVFAGAGALDLVESYDYFMKSPITTQPSTIPILVLGIDYAENLNLDIKKIFKGELLKNYKEWILSKKYTTKEVTIFMGSNNINDFLAPELFSRTHPNTAKFIDALKRNSLGEGWKPKAELHLIHGNEDNIVPYVNSTKAYEYFKSQGCNVILKTIEGKNHIPAGDDFYMYCITNILTRDKAN